MDFVIDNDCAIAILVPNFLLLHNLKPGSPTKECEEPMGQIYWGVKRLMSNKSEGLKKLSLLNFGLFTK